MPEKPNEVKTFRADSVNEAIVKVKMQLGEGAEIVETREVTEGGFLGFFASSVVEVDAYVPPGTQTSNGSTSTGKEGRSGTVDRDQLRKQIKELSRSLGNETPASSNTGSSGTHTKQKQNRSNGQEWNVDDPVMPNFSARDRARELIEQKANQINGSGNSDGSGTYDRTAVRERPNNNSSNSPLEQNGDSSLMTSEKKEIEQLVEKTDLIAERVDDLVDSMDDSERDTANNPNSQNFPGELNEIFQQLLAQDVEKKFARNLVGRVRKRLEAEEFHDFELIQDQVKEEIRDEFQAPEPLLDTQDDPILVPFVGPTGVGKTTTIAKLAAYYSVEEGRSVGFVTLDGYRLAAVEQLRRYAEILRVPLRDVTDTEEVDEAIGELTEQNVEVVFVDTAGRSQFDDEKIEELENVFSGELTTKTHLVISANSRSRDIKSVLDGFGEVGFDRLAITKLDETEAYGSIYNLLKRTKIPIAYFTDGQEVPDDLWIAEADQVADLIVREEES